MSGLSKDYYYKQPHTYRPYTPSFRNNDEIRISVCSQDLYTLPGHSLIQIEGKVTYAPKADGAATDDGKSVILTNNALAFLFDQVRYELNGVEIDRTRHVGVTSTAKTLLTCTKDEAAALEIAGWGAPVFNAADKTFRGSIPLGFLLGFANDFKGYIVRMKQDLVLIRSRTNKNSYVLKDGAEENAVTLEVETVQWIMPQLKFNLGPEKAILDKVKSNGSFQISFRSWETHEYPQLPINNKETWKLMTRSNVEAPDDFVLVFQSSRMDDEKKDASKFDHVRLRSFRVHLNSTSLPYENLNENFDRNKYLNFYQNYLNFITEYSNGEKLCEPPLSFEKFKSENPMFVMHCTYPDIIKPGPLDIQIDMESDVNFPKNTSAYAILVHNVTYSYKTLTGEVKRVY